MGGSPVARRHLIGAGVAPFIAQLDPGETVELTATFTLGNKPVTNVGTADGTDVLGEHVTDHDNATVDVVIPEVVHKPPKPKPTAFTGFDDAGLVRIALILLVIGLAAVLVGRRRFGRNQEA